MTVRWRRREVPRMRITWCVMVVVLFMVAHMTLIENVDLGRTGNLLTFIPMVILPTIALILWRLGLLPPERVVEAGEPGP